MSSHSSPSQDISRDILSTLITDGISPQEFPRKLFYFNLEQVRATDPDLAEIMLACAIPRYFDATIIGIMRAKSEDRETNERLLNELLEFNFVVRRKSGGYVYHDNVRDLLLEDWQNNEKNRPQFNEINQRLATFYKHQHEAAQQIEQRLRRVGYIIQQANMNRYVQLISAIETRLISPLIEALYHEILRSAKIGVDFFREQYHHYEDRRQLTICESLLNATRDHLERSPSGEGKESQFLWLSYFEARLANNLNRYQEAEAILRDLLPKTEGDIKLKLWALGDMSIALENQSKLSQAREVCQQELILAKETGADPYNLAVFHSRVASVYWSSGELKQAADKFQDAIKAAQTENNPESESFQKLLLCGVLQQLGEGNKALFIALEVFHLARTKFLQNIKLNQAVAQQLMPIIYHRDPVLLDTVFSEAKELLFDLSSILTLRSSYVNLLQNCGQLSRAETEIVDLKQKTASYADKFLQTEVLFQESLLYKDRGQLALAIDLCNQVISRFDRSLGTKWNYVASLTNCGMYNSSLAQWSEAKAKLEKAIAQWQEIGHEKLTALTKIAYADMYRQQGELSQIQMFLEEVGEGLSGEFSSNLAEYHQAQGDLYKNQGQWQKASEHYQQALTINDNLSLDDRAAHDLNALAKIAANQGHWREAVKYTTAANQLWHELAAAAQYRSSETAIRSVEKNTQGLKAIPTDVEEYFSQAQTLLEEVGERLSDELSSYLADYYQVQGELYRNQGRCQEASEHYQQALTVNYTLEQYGQAAHNLNILATIAANQGDWQEAAKYTNEANKIWHQLAAAARYLPTETTTQANENNAQGLKIITTHTEREQKENARDLFQSASELMPENFWYSLNLMYACVELGEWAEAIQAVKTIMNRGTEWIASHNFLYERLTEYSLKRGEVLLEAERYEDTAQIYADIYHQIAGKLSLDRLILDWQKLGDRLLKLKRFQDAQREYEAALICVASAENPTLQASFQARLGFLLTIQTANYSPDANSDAYRKFTQALKLYHESNDATAGKLLGEVCQSLLGGIKEYWILDSAWHTFQDATESNQGLQEDFAGARSSLNRYLDNEYKLSAKLGESFPYFPVVTPIAVELDRNLVPDGTETEWELFKTYIPEMRDRIKNEMGVRVPGLRIRGSDETFLSESYIIMLDEIPLVLGKLKADMGYCPESPGVLQTLGISQQTLAPTEHPLTGKLGCWIPSDTWEIITRNGLELWTDPLLYMVYHVEALLRRNLADFLGVQEVENLLETWEQEDEGSYLIEKALPDSISRLHFARVLRALVKERVSITSWKTILKAVRNCGLDNRDISGTVRAVRLQLKEYLPGNGPSAERINLPPEVEDKIIPWIWHEEGKTFFAIPPEETQELLSDIRELVTLDNKNIVLVIQNTELRPFIRRLVELEFPDLMVISQEELLSQDEQIDLSELANTKDSQ